MSARKPHFTAAERATLEPLMVRCVVACVERARAENAYRRAKRPWTNALLDRRTDALVETIAAGKAFDRALAKFRGGK